METELDEYQKTIYTNELKGYQLRLVLSEFREKFYIHIRKYFLSYDEGYLPSSEGVSMEASFENTMALAEATLGLLSTKEIEVLMAKYLPISKSNENKYNYRN